MGLNIFSKQVAEKADLPVKYADGSPLRDDDGNIITATVFGPATKIWQVAEATMRRKRMKRTREANGKYEAAIDEEIEDEIEFLCSITQRFNGLEKEEGVEDRDLVRKVYSEPKLGYVRDQMVAATQNWENFTKASQSASNSGSAS